MVCCRKIIKYHKILIFEFVLYYKQGKADFYKNYKRQFWLQAAVCGIAVAINNDFAAYLVIGKMREVFREFALKSILFKN